MKTALCFILLVTTCTLTVKCDCDADVQDYINSLSGETTPQMWSLEMFDSSTKFPLPDATLELSTAIQIVNFDECLAVSGPLDATGHPRFTGQYCQFSPGYDLGNFVRNISQPSSTVQSAMNSMMHLITRNSNSFNKAQTVMLPFFWAVCAPSSCGPEGVKRVADFNMQFFATGLGLQANTSVVHQSCYYDNDGTRNLDAASWSFVVCVVLLVLVIIFGTALDVRNFKKFPGWLENIFLAFSLKRNFEELVRVPEKLAPSQIGCVHGIRALSMLWIVFCHSYSSTTLPPFFNVSKSWYMAPLLNGFMAVDSFFFLSGLLSVYVPLMESSKGRSFNIFKYYAYRYLRITLPLAFVTWYLSSVHVYLGNGPLWAIYVETGKQLCVQNWLPTLFYITNYFYQHCVTQAWYLCVDMQLALLSPLIIFPLIKWPRYGLAALALLTAASVAGLFAVTFVEQLPWTAIFFDSTGKSQRFYDIVYENTPLRATPYLCGMGLGYVMAQRIKVQLPKWAVLVGWLVSLALLAGVVFIVLLPYRDGFIYRPLEAAFYTSLHRLVWSLGLCWIVWACVNGFGGFINDILTWKYFQIMSKLSFGAYLVHLCVIIGSQSTSRTVNNVTNFEVLYWFSAFLIIILPYTLFLYMAVEMPSMQILRTAFGKSSVTKGSKEAFN
ncbi:Hypothetical predicted protein [Cloeon dipterum]|uniref:Nose resistant-to-fluoxetine protein N-terminal domain-containing protein n=1 Tax=Cloeon dipterum TaxID=197152 RepID=A0A8S1CIA3_9INSE|nr:Hypothetical predicted protein [Cloeon dipterum]